MNGRFLLDTNTISVAVSGRSTDVDRHIAAVRPGQLCASTIAYGEIWFGLHRRPHMAQLRETTTRFLAEIDILPWTQATADVYAQLRADMERAGKSLGALDMLIAAHALHVGATLVTSDRAFRFVPKLNVEDWLAG